MRDEEKKIYHSLSTAEAKREFIHQFWKMRDPDPTTEENENRMEFENRVMFANEWFGNWRTFAGKSMGSGSEKDRGWKTSKGRVYIILGPPDMVNYGMGWGPMRLHIDNSNTSETWYYLRFELLVHFSKRIPSFWQMEHGGEKDKGEPYLRNWDYELVGSTDLLYAMEDAKLEMINRDYRGSFLRIFRADAKYQDDTFTLKIPIEGVTFQEKEGQLHAMYQLKITVFRENKKVDAVEEKKTCCFPEEEALSMDYIILKVPYRVPQKGRYKFDLVLTDLKSLYGAQFRKIIEKKI
jgi:GWxTD domain-containing protein